MQIQVQKKGSQHRRRRRCSLPKIEENRINKWTTAIKIKYKENFLDDIKKQLISIQDEVLLFVNHINKLKIEIDDELKTAKARFDISDSTDKKFKLR